MSVGIPKIKIPVQPKDVSLEIIELYLDTVFGQFEQNARHIKEYYDFYCLGHAILSKVRPYNDSQSNNIVLVPTIKAMVDWKTGYTVGNPIKYAQSKTIDTDDIEILNKYVRSSCKRFVDKEVTKWAYATGVGYYFIEPKSETVDAITTAPFELYCREAHTCSKVYSSYGGNKPLFDILYTVHREVDEQKRQIDVKLLDIYTHDMLYKFRLDLGKWVLYAEESRGFSKPLPLVEKRFSTDGIGIVAMGQELQNALDRALSLGLDNVEDVVNAIFVYSNVDLGSDASERRANHLEMVNNGAIAITSGSKDFPASVELLSVKLNINELITLCGTINEMFHASLGVPMEMSGTNSGGTTKSGSEVANGYDNAYNRALDDVNTFLIADTELLEKIMWICKNTANNPINSLATSEIEIKYSLNLTDNMLTKSQSYISFIQSGMPPAMALRYTRLSNDPEAEGKLIEEYRAQLVTTAQPQLQTSQENV